MDNISCLSRIKIAKISNIPVTALNGIAAKRDTILNSVFSNSEKKENRKYENTEEIF